MEDFDYKECCFFTGHRIIAASEKHNLEAMTEKICIDLIEAHGVSNFICGGAIGYDTLAAMIILNLKKIYPYIKLHLYLPCRDQTKKWNSKDKAAWKYIYSLADEHKLIYDGSYIKGCMQYRNTAMVESAYYGIAYCKHSYGGTYSTIKKALDKERCIFFLPDNKFLCSQKQTDIKTETIQS